MREENKPNGTTDQRPVQIAEHQGRDPRTRDRDRMWSMAVLP